MSHQVERDWTTKSGHRAVVIMTSMGHRCGYVGIDKRHPLHGRDYSEDCPELAFPETESVGKRGLIPLICSNGKASPDVVFDVHGGITYAGDGKGKYPVPAKRWWFGFDCAHLDDTPARCDLGYCVNECESLSEQLVSRLKKAA